MRKICASVLHPIAQPAIAEGVLILDEQGQVLAIETKAEHDPASLEHYDGHLVPGFINTHCHLELSHMLGRVNTGTGLIEFIKGVVSQRQVAPEFIEAALSQADADMYAQGIVAVGDISNVPDTFACKARSPIRYYSFVECFDFLQAAQAQAEFDKYQAVYQALQTGNKDRKSLVPHAPYSVSPKLFALINAANQGAKQTISIHNQETPPENELFLQGKGGFVDFYAGFGMSLADFQAPGKTAIHYALAHLDPQHRTLFVHNSLTTAEDIRAAQAWSAEVFWATCPNANLYIENRLPNYQAFLDTGAKVTIGTDSLTSNWQLSVLEELKTIQRYQSYLDLPTLLRWATLNGAEALGFEAELGSFEPGKRPGVNLLSGISPQGRLGNFAQVRRLV